MKAKLLFFIPALVYTLAIAYLSLINLANTPVKDFGVSDKLLHGGAYLVMALLWLFFVFFTYGIEKFSKSILIVCGLTVIFGIFIEVLQDALTEYRELDFYDIIANSVGVLIAAVLVWPMKEYLIRLKTKINSFLLKI